jgi:hypothetical protein
VCVGDEGDEPPRLLTSGKRVCRICGSISAYGVLADMRRSTGRELGISCSSIAREDQSMGALLLAALHQSSTFGRSRIDGAWWSGEQASNAKETSQ